MEGLDVLTNIAIILLIGLLITLLSKKLKTSNVLLLVLAGILLQIFSGSGSLFVFTPVFLVGVSVLAIVMIVFDSTSRFKWKDLDLVSVNALKLTGWFTLTNLVILSFLGMILIYRTISVEYYLYGMMFASVMIATDASSLFVMLGTVKHKVINLLELESIINTPLTVLLPFIILDLVLALGQKNLVVNFLSQIVPFLQQIIVGLGAGILIGIIVFKIMKHAYSEQLSPIAIITAALLAYIVAENLSGNGILAVATLGLFFGSVYVKQKSSLQEFSYLLSNSLEILVFVLVGLTISLPLTPEFFINSFVLFLALLFCRGFSVSHALRKEDLTAKEKLFVVLNMPKGIAMAVVVFTLALMKVGPVNQMLDYLLVILIYSLILSTIVTKLSKYFIKIDVEEAKTLNGDSQPK